MNRRLLHAALWATVVALVAGCAQVSKVNNLNGQVVVKERLTVDVPDSWNQFERGEMANTPTWTNEGLFVDALQFYVGLKNGALIAPTPSEPKGVQALEFKSSMQAAEVVDLFQKLWSRDGSVVSLERVQPQAFLGGDGFRFEYSVVRKIDDVRLQGVAWGAVRNGELFVINYSAPRLAFFARYKPRVEAIAQSARLKL
jgi:hypothetical protein